MAKRSDRDEREDLPLEKNDRLAMWISGMLVVGLPFLLMILIVAAAVYLLFGRG